MGAGRWVIDTAVRAGQVCDGLGFAHELGDRAHRSTRSVGTGATGMHRVGMEQRRRRLGAQIDDRVGVLVGQDGSMFHSDGDRTAALSMLDVAFAMFRHDAEPTATAIDASPARQQWWEVDVLPLLSDWATFRDHESSWASRLATEWSTYQAWHQVIRGMRSGARAQGIALASPEPPPLPMTMFQRAGAGQGSRLEAAWTIGRSLVYTAIGLAGAVGIYTVWRDLKASRDRPPPP